MMVSPNDLDEKRRQVSAEKFSEEREAKVAMRKVIDVSTTEIEYVMGHWLDAGYSRDQAIALSEITLANVLDTGF